MARYELDGKVAVITGAARGIGRGIALRLAREGCDIAILELAEGAAAVGKAMGLGRRAIALHTDVTQRSDVQTGIEQVTRELGRIDILVNNAGVLRITPVLEITDQEWDQHMSVNAKAVLL